MNTKENTMVAAHKAGVAAYHVNGTGVDMSHVIRHARKLYDNDHDQEAFLAGYIGAMRRDIAPTWKA